jgi:transposase
MYLMTSTRHGVAAKEIERQAGVTYKCAWRICHELRKLMASADYHGPLGGDGKHVEVDETLVGGAVKGQGQGKHADQKTIVFGIVERGGKIRTGTIPDQSAYTIEPIIFENIIPGTTISTDTHGAYRTLVNLLSITEWLIIRRMNGCAVFITQTRLKDIGRISNEQ